jgi:glutamyl-tRNA reductase
MNIFCIGINHRTAPIEVREKLWFSQEEIRTFLSGFKERHATECLLTSTCNRTELYYSPREESLPDPGHWKLLVDLKNAGEVAGEQHFYSLSALRSVKHLFSVACGIDSMVIGDVQILNQLKEAYTLAQETGSTGSIVNRLVSTALHAGKRARTETEIGEGAVSISYAAAELASKIFDDLSKRTALLIGAGETGKLTAKHLAGRSLGKLLLANRTLLRAEEIASSLGGNAVPFEELLSTLPSVDIIISAVDVQTYILSADQLRQAMKLRGNKPLFIIDIGVPRNIDPAANSIENIFLHDIDALNHIIDNNVAHRKQQIQKVEEIILHEVTEFNNWYTSLQVTPTIQELREQFELIRSSEVEKHLRQFDPQHQEALDLVTKRIVNKILHTPLVNLKNGSNGYTSEKTKDKIHLLRHLFGLDKTEHS